MADPDVVHAWYDHPVTTDNGILRVFDSGATRDTNEGKLEPWGFTSSLTEKVFCEYMNKHRVQSDGSLRDSDNWKRGFTLDSYWHSMSRHVMDFRLLWEGHKEESRTQDMIDALCGIKFNVDALIRELARNGQQPPLPPA